MRIPVDPEWKVPYKSLLKDMLRISDNLVKEKRNQTAKLIKAHQIGNVEDFDKVIDVEKEIQKSQGTLVAGCKGDDCD
jgi:hypothetical protein